MAGKIFISYRREDTAANALGISQYLEKEFGRKSVFIDVDMRAGAKFPSVLEQRLAECKVMLVLIGPDWLDSRDEQGNRRLDSPDDWPRLEIAQALKRDITVIPVRVGNADLPSRTELPEDIRGLVDHQAISITIPGFRHEMSGLARDIRAIPSRRHWWRFGMVSTGLLLFIIAVGVILLSIFSNSFERVREIAHPSVPSTPRLNSVWNSSPGEWVMYAVDKQPVAYYFKPSSIQIFGDAVAFTSRFPFKRPAEEATSFQSAYQDNTIVIDCKRSVFITSETTVYNTSGEVISRYKKGDPQTLNLSAADQIPPGSVLSGAHYIFCDEKLRSSNASRITTATQYLSTSPNGEPEMFNSPMEKLSDGIYETLLVFKFYRDQPFSNLFPGQEIVGLPTGFRTIVESVRINCAEKNKVETPKSEYLNADNILEFLQVPMPLPTLDVTAGSALAMLVSRACDINITNVGIKNVGGDYEGTNYLAFKTGGTGDQKISISIEQTGNQLKVSFRTPNGGQGEGTGVLEGNEVKTISLNSTAKNCPGSYEGSLKFNDDGSMDWSFKGQDCGGSMEGHGTAKKTKA